MPIVIQTYLFIGMFLIWTHYILHFLILFILCLYIFVCCFSFPKDSERKKIWLHNLRLQNAKPWHRICSNHFKVNDFSSDTLKLRILNTNAIPHSNIDKQICTIIETENDENVSFSNGVKDVESDTNLTLEHNISSPTTPERYFYNTICISFI